MKLNFSTCSFVAWCVCLSLQAFANEVTPSEWLTKGDRSVLLTKQSVSLAFNTNQPVGPTIKIDDHEKFQAMDGFGFALTGGSAMHIINMSPAKRTALLQELFGTGPNDIGISYLRVSIGASDLNDHVFSYDDLAPGETDPTMTHFSLGPDKLDVIPVLKEILTINPRIKILGSPWSAPTWMKNNSNVKGGSLKPECYDAYARYFVDYLQVMQAEGIHLDAITVQNEPLNEGNTPSMHMTAEEEGLFIKQHLGPAFASANINTKIILYDHNCDVPEYPLTILRDADAAKYVDGSGFHHYAGKLSAMTDVHAAFPDKNLYFTEQMVIDRGDPPHFDIAAQVSRLIVNVPRNWGKNVLLWNLAADSNNEPHTSNGGCTMCQGAITIDGDTVTRNLAYYVVAHASKFVRPNSQRISSNTVEGLSNIAFQTQAGTALIVANHSQTAQNFNVQFHDQTFATSLDAGAVATYVW